MPKYIVETVQVIKRKYYCEADDPLWINDSIIMGDLDEFSSQSLSEDITNTTQVSEFPRVGMFEDINAATYKYNYDTQSWDQVVRWDLK